MRKIFCLCIPWRKHTYTSHGYQGHGRRYPRAPLRYVRALPLSSSNQPHFPKVRCNQLSGSQGWGWIDTVVPQFVSAKLVVYKYNFTMVYGSYRNRWGSEATSNWQGTTLHGQPKKKGNVKKLTRGWKRWKAMEKCWQSQRFDDHEDESHSMMGTMWGPQTL